MRSPSRLVLASALIALLAGCAAEVESPFDVFVDVQPQFDVRDAPRGGAVPGFAWLVPWPPDPSAFPGTFDPDFLSLDPRIDICEVQDDGADGLDACVGPVLRTLGRDDPPFPENMQVDAVHGLYFVWWNTMGPDIQAGGRYRAVLRVDDIVLGWMDLQAVTGRHDLPSVAPGFVPFLLGWHYPFRFRVETGIAGSIVVTPPAATLPDAGTTPPPTQDLTALVSDLYGNPLAGVPVAWASGLPGIVSVPAAGSPTDAAGQTTVTATVVGTVDAPREVPVTASAQAVEGRALLEIEPTATGPRVLLPTESCADFGPDFVASFEDPAIEAAVRNTMGLGPSDPLTCGLLPRLSALFAQNAGVVSLAGVQNLTGLTLVMLDRNAITDLGPLGALPRLSILVISRNPVTDLSPLAAIGTLVFLRAEFSAVADLAPLSGLPLRTLVLEGTAVTDLGPLSSVPTLGTLSVASTSVADLGPLAGLASMISLNASDTPVADLGPIAGLTAMTSLFIDDTAVSSLAPLAGLTGLGILHASRAAISDLGPLAGLTGLVTLRLNENAITDVGPLSGLTALTQLRLDGNAIVDVGPLAGLTALSNLGLTGNAVSDIGALSGMTAMSQLEIGENQIVDLGPISGMAGIAILDLRNNLVTDVGPLSGLTSLIALILSSNQVADVAPLAGLTSLSNLALGDNALLQVDAVAGLTALSSLDLLDNPALSDIQGVLDNPGIGPGDFVRLQGTAVSCADVSTLRARGVTVVSLCP